MFDFMNRMHQEKRGRMNGPAQPETPAASAESYAPSSPAGDQADLFQELMSRQGSIGGGAEQPGKQGMATGGKPEMFPGMQGMAIAPQGMPNPSTKVPPAWDRYQTAQQMMEGYRNGWQPNPLLTRILGGR